MTNTTRPAPVSVILFSSDLMLISTVGGTAAAAGHHFCTVANAADLMQKMADDNVLFCLDLSASGADPEIVAAKIPAETLRSAIAFGPHVHIAKLDAARQAGFGRVLSRGQFVMRISELLTGSCNKDDDGMATTQSRHHAPP